MVKRDLFFFSPSLFFSSLPFFPSFLSFLSFSFFLFFTSLLSESSYAHAQVLRVAENTTIKANIADTEPTRIAVENDRIAVLRGREGAYTYSNDTQSGAIFLKPTEAYQKKPFYIFISTEQNHHYILQLKPTPTVSAGVLLLKPKSQALQTAERWEMNSPYIETLTQLMTQMANENAPEGYEILPVNAKKTISINQARMRLKTVYSGAHLQGKIYEVTNTASHPVLLIESIFYQPEDRAIALRNTNLAAGAKTLLYKVSAHG